MSLSPNDQAAIAYEALTNFMVKADMYREGRERLLGLIMDHWSECGEGEEVEAALLDAARAWVFHCDNKYPRPEPIVRHDEEEETPSEGFPEVVVNGVKVDLFDVISGAKLPTVRRLDLRREPRKVIAAEVRRLFKDLGIKGLSVTAPNYSMASSIDITFPPTEHPGRDRSVASDWADHDSISCEVCIRSHRAKTRLEAIILAAFPDLDNRSDSQSDHFDYKFSIH